VTACRRGRSFFSTARGYGIHETAGELCEAGLAVETDATDEASVEAAVERLDELDCLANNVRKTHSAFRSPSETSDF
jgi:NAD(P)-dependent dehydrogenase (short-subunit alcohol dehydrogenase family)